MFERARARIVVVSLDPCRSRRPSLARPHRDHDPDPHRGCDRHGISHDYAERFFVLTGARVEERAIVLDLAPVALETPTPNPSAILLVDDFLPRFLIGMVARRDMLFATCSE